jgi:hypothetical protein
VATAEQGRNTVVDGLDVLILLFVVPMLATIGYILGRE